VADVFHFPFRTREQWERKGVRRARADKPLGQYVRALQAHELGRAEDQYRSLVVDEAALERGLAAGHLAVDTRLRDVLRRLRGAGLSATGSAWVGAGDAVIAPDGDRLSPRLDRSLTAESAGLLDADVVRLFRHLDGLGARVKRLEETAGSSREAR
jgi:hypothetical protein